ncbi:hypothetical protein [Micromonospora sp. CA-246542]
MIAPSEGTPKVQQLPISPRMAKTREVTARPEEEGCWVMTTCGC